MAQRVVRDRVLCCVKQPDTREIPEPRRQTQHRILRNISLEAALIVLRESSEPMNIKQIMEKINERGLAKLAGKTPSATISAAIQRDIILRKEESRFTKAGKGLFAAR